MRFPGQYFDAETGLHHNGFRPYDPDSGRYIQADPLGTTGGLNLYLYALGNPLLNIDPFGLYTLLQCSADEETQIAAAIEEVKRKIRDCLSCDDVRKVLEELERAVIRCSGSLRSQRDPTKQLCGINTAPHSFAITPEGLRNGGCGPVAATVLHETMHLTGYGAEFEAWLDELERQCFP